MNVEHFYLLGAVVHESSNSYGFEVYLVRFMGFLNNSLGTTSDVFILLMTIDRFNLLNNVEKLDGGARKGWIIRWGRVLAINSSLIIMYCMVSDLEKIRAVDGVCLLRLLPHPHDFPA